MSRIFVCLTLFYVYLLHCIAENVCFKENSCIDEKSTRYLFYDVNPSEGFNLRRDVYMRFSVLAHKLATSMNPLLSKFKLVLPPWSYLVHWRYRDKPEHIPWGYYFDLKSLQLFAPVIEMYDFFSVYGRKYSKVNIDEVYTLEHFEDMFETGKFEDKIQLVTCQREEHTFFFYHNITSNNFYCLSYHGPATKLSELFMNISAQLILINHAEVALHEYFGNKLYWQARRSMRFNTELKEIAAEFRRNHLQSSDEVDNTISPDDWRDEKPKRNAFGGPYLAVHLRRRDFTRSRPQEAPPLDIIAGQISRSLRELELKTVFVATDAPIQEFNNLTHLLGEYDVIRYVPSKNVEEKYKEGGIAIIDQIICSYARNFIGTHESTFSFRIQEEREILGFPIKSTFNVFCRDVNNCPKPSVWQIVY